jgi:DNA-binding transcriptional ArsR family regulator
MPEQDRSVQLLAQMFRILGDPTRLSILVELKKGELNVTNICRRLSVSQPTVSRHLSILRMGGLVHNRRSGKEIYYSLSEFQADPTGRSLKALLHRTAAIRIGPIILGLAKS